MSARPRVTLAYAQTLDGRLATRDGSSQWIGGARSLEFAHRLRAAHDAIMVGMGTVRADNPRLTVRLVAGRDPLRVVVDSRLRIPLTAAVMQGDAARGTLVATTGAASPDRVAELQARGATVLVLPHVPDGVDLVALFAALSERGIRSVMVEGGATLITNLLRQRLADELAVTVAPKLLGRGIDAVGDLGILRLGDASRVQEMRVEWHEPDIVVRGQLVYAGGDDA